MSKNLESAFSAQPPEPNVHTNCIIDPLVTEDGFSPDECQKILDQFSPDEWEESMVNATETSAEMMSAPLVRKSKNVFLKHSPESEWLFQRLLALIIAANHKSYNFDVDFFSAVQLAKYEEGDFYDWHFDMGPEHMGNRKLSMTVQLSAEDSYEGGDLVLDFGNFVASRKLGSATVFPSFLKHKVEPVTKGTRYSIVVWVSGTNRFK